jgi:hypothetical protein
VGEVTRDGDVERENVPGRQPLVADLVAHPVAEVLGFESTDDDRAVFAILVENPVVVTQRVGRSDLCGLLSRQRRVRPHATLPLEAHCPLVEVASQFHFSIHRDERLVRYVRDRRVRPDPPVVVENLSWPVSRRLRILSHYHRERTHRI